MIVLSLWCKFKLETLKAERKLEICLLLVVVKRLPNVRNHRQIHSNNERDVGFVAAGRVTNHECFGTPVSFRVRCFGLVDIT